MGRDIEQKLEREHEAKVERALREQEREMRDGLNLRIQAAVIADRKAQADINNQILEQVSKDLSNSFQVILVKLCVYLFLF